jgi:hypothetical protein
MGLLEVEMVQEMRSLEPEMGLILDTGQVPQMGLQCKNLAQISEFLLRAWN